MPPRLEIQVSKTRTLRLLVLTSVMVALCYFLTTLPEVPRQVFGWMGICIFSPCFIIFLRLFFRTGPQVIIDERGIEDKRSKAGLVEWDDVVTLSIGKVYSQRFLCIEVVDARKYLDRLPAVAKAIARSNRALGFTEITIGFSAFSHTPGEVMNFIREHHMAASK